MRASKQTMRAWVLTLPRLGMVFGIAGFGKENETSPSFASPASLTVAFEVREFVFFSIADVPLR